MAKWFFQVGAKSVMLLSRSGGTNPKAKTLVEEYRAQNVSLRILQCDVGDEDQVRQAVESCSTLGYPVRGVVHGAMVLNVSSNPNLSAKSAG